jgi:hypothetical protein
VIKYYRRFIAPERYLSRWLDPRLETLRVAEVQAYLLRRGWKPVPPDRPHTLVFQEPPGEEEGEPLYQFVPDVETRPDYARQMVELITLLAFFEDRHPVQILEDILGEAARGQPNGANEDQGQRRDAEVARK